MEIKTFNDLYRFVMLVCKWNDFVDQNRRYSNGLRMPVIHCNDGFAMSVQAGSSFYSLPRKDLEENYIRAEVGYPTQPEELLFEFAEGDPMLYEEEGLDFDYTKEVYPFTPVTIIDQVIEKHGGISHLGGWD